MTDDASQEQLPTPVAFQAQPALHASAAAAASLLGHGIPAALMERMLTAPGLRPRLDAALTERLGACPSRLTPAQAQIASLDPAGLTRLALRSGAAWHAARIAKTFDGPMVRTLVERIGAEFREVALADLAANPETCRLDPGPDIAVTDLPTAIARDGTACLVAWCEAQSPPVGRRVLLRLRINARPGPQHAAAGPAIVERIVLARPAAA